jgi:5-methylcytosine-specific restriction endonuclease McrA
LLLDPRLKMSIFARDKGCCVYCGRSGLTLTVDHVVPRSRGGLDVFNNLVAACETCNSRKGSLHVETFRKEARR